MFVVAGMMMIGPTAIRGAHYARGEVIPEVKLKDGTLLHDVTVVAVGATTLVARWHGGQGSIVLAQLPPEMRDAFAPAVAPKTAVAPEPEPMVSGDPASAGLPTEIKLTNGFVMHRSRVTRWAEQSVLVSYPGGIVSVQFKHIVPEQRVIFEARRTEALARQAREDAHRAVVTAAVSQTNQVRRTRERLLGDEADQKSEAINRGVAERYLVKGMTKEQAKQAYGRPQRGDDRNGTLFFYDGRGRDKYGNSADRVLLFNREEILTDWWDQRGNELDGNVQRSTLDDGLHGPPR